MRLSQRHPDVWIIAPTHFFPAPVYYCNTNSRPPFFLGMFSPRKKGEKGGGTPFTAPLEACTTQKTVMIDLLLFLQKQNLANAIYLFGLGTLLSGLGLKHMRIRSHHDLAGALVTTLLLGRPWWSTTPPTCLPLSVFTITSDQH
jgi:hypothetical protein